MERAVPVLQIDEYQAAVDYYVTGLGFEIDFEHRHEPGFPVFMCIKRREVYIQLSEHGRGHSGSEVYVFINDLQSFYERCVANEIPTHGPPDQKAWGNTDLVLTDPFRNTLRFSQISTHPSAGNTPNKP